MTAHKTKKPKKASKTGRVPPAKRRVATDANDGMPWRLFVITGHKAGLPAQLTVRLAARTQNEAWAVFYLMCDHAAETANKYRT